MSGSLFVGWPLAAPGADGRLGFTTGSQSLRESLWNLLMTNPGERLMRPALGAGLADRIGQPNTQTTRQLLASEIAATIATWEARVSVTAIDVTPAPDDAAQVRVTVSYIARGAPPGAVDQLAFLVKLGGR